MRQILKYLLANPTARDTAAGIQQWWLHNTHSRSLVEQSLHALEARGWITTFASTAGASIYGLNPAANLEATRFTAEDSWQI